MSALERFFGLRERGSTVRTELSAGGTTFLAMAYIVAVHPGILAAAGMPPGPVLTATCLSAGLASLAMGLFARLPIGLAPGMGTNAYFAYAVCGALGVPWPTALGAVFLSGCAFLLITLTGLRERVVDAIPVGLQQAIAAGIGLFIGFIGLKNAGLVVDHPATLVTLGPVASSTGAVFGVGFVLTVALLARQVKGALLIGIVAATAAAIGLGEAEAPTALVSAPPSLAPIALYLDVPAALGLGLLNLVFAFAFVDLFDTLATLVAVGEHGGLMVEGPDGRRRLPRAKAAMVADSTGTMLGALLGTSTVTAYVESTAGITAGGRTGLTAVTVGVLFLLAPFFAPLVQVVPLEATAPALVVVAAAMLRAAAGIRFDDMTEAGPAALVCLAIPLTFSISDGLSLGFVAYAAAKLVAGRPREVSAPLMVLAALFVARFLYLG